MGGPEIDAMSAVATALADLAEDAQGRVLRWAAERYGLSVPAGGRSGMRRAEAIADEARYNGPAESRGRRSWTRHRRTSTSLSCSRPASPKTNEDKALVAAYWVQVHEGQLQWQSRRLNSELKHLGHGSPNITDALSSTCGRSLRG
jgi:hypothetical protein